MVIWLLEMLSPVMVRAATLVIRLIRLLPANAVSLLLFIGTWVKGDGGNSHFFYG